MGELDEKARTILRKAGTALIVLGVLDIAVMAWCILHLRAYASSFNVLAVAAGIALRRGSLRAAKVVGAFSGLYLAGLATAPVLLLALPVELLTAYAQLHPFTVLKGSVIPAGILGFLIWLRRQVESGPVLEARRAEGLVARFPRLPVLAGAATVVVLLIGLRATQSSEAATRAVELAREQVGPGYRYLVTTLHLSTEGTRASVIAYRSGEIREVAVRW